MDNECKSRIRQETHGHDDDEAVFNIHTCVRTKIFNDPIHGHMEIHPPCVAIIDTPQFQRLRHIKQICGSYYVYSGCSHNRFEHSIGVCYLAGQLTAALQRRQPELEIDDKDILCLEIAGLCHDLGHGPFSHLFEGKFIPEVIGENRTWTHEEASIAMFDYMYAKNESVKDEFTKFGLGDNDRKFIKELIAQNEQTQRPEKRFLYDIVANKTSGIDVDKWDYFARDCHMLGIKSNFDHMRLMSSARVIKTGSGDQHICFREKDAIGVYDMFHTRYTLHIRAYQHKTARSIEAGIKDALVLANDFLQFQGEKGIMFKMSGAIYDMTAYMKMTDENIFNRILYDTHNHQNADRARKILENVCKRNIYKLVDQTQLKADKIAKNTRNKSRESKERILSILRTDIPEVKHEQLPNEEDVFVDVVNLNYGKANQNPIDSVYFYSKAKPDKPFRLKKEQVSQMLPETFEEQYIRLYIKNGTPQQVDYLKKAFHLWCKDNNYPDPKGM